MPTEPSPAAPLAERVAELESRLSNMTEGVLWRSEVLGMIVDRLNALGCCHDGSNHDDTPPMMYNDWISCVVAKRQKVIAKLEQENARLRAALEFYADPGTYHAIMIIGDRPCGGFADDFSDDHGDEDYLLGEERDGVIKYDTGKLREMPGARARAALGSESQRGET